jgi:hypothetical protein
MRDDDAWTNTGRNDLRKEDDVVGEMSRRTTM